MASSFQTDLYQQALDHLNDLQFFRIKLGLNAIKNILATLGNPQDSFRAIHIAGTNGKGSIGSTLVSVLLEHDYKVSFYSSPHLSSVRERFQINNQLIPKEDFTKLSLLIRQKLKGQKITYFEFTTALAFLWFQQQEVDIAIIETGLGGRLDATNVITPLVSVITNIDLDHQQYLGNTIKDIAFEKAGIIKKKIPVVTGMLSLEAQQVVVNKCNDQNAPLYSFGKAFNADHIALNSEKGSSFKYQGINGDEISLATPLIGIHQVENTAIALSVLELLNSKSFQLNSAQIQTGLLNVSWPGRLEQISITSKNDEANLFLLDGAHNDAGIKALLSAIKKIYHQKNIILIWGSMADKNLGEPWFELLQHCQKIILTQAEPIRSATPQQLFHQVPVKLHPNTICISSPEKAIREAQDLSNDDQLICVAGSLYLVGITREILLKEVGTTG